MVFIGKGDKELYSTESASTQDNQRHYKQSLDYRYNIRGWLTRINNSDITSTSNLQEDDAKVKPDLFGMNLGYNDDQGTGNAAEFGGNISAIKWSTNQGLDAVKERAYNYSYDAMNRILSATHQQKTTLWSSSTAFHEKNFSYDNNGNILGLKRYDKNGLLIDSLKYNYGAGSTKSNQLVSVTDAGDITQGFVDGNIAGADYTYDVNGNMTVDKNKAITLIKYNHLNLPTQVTKSTGDYINYVYDASGRKISQQVFNPSNVLKKKTDYLGEFYYENDTLKFINHEEGRIVMTGGAPEYQYHLKDHVGNVRTTFTTNPGPIVSATFELAAQPTEQYQFLRYDDARLINSTLFDHTHLATASHYAERLNGSANEKTGLEKSLSVMPGDTVKLEVYAKYVDPNSSNWSAALATLLSQIANGTAPAGTVIDGAGYATNGNTAFPFTGLAGEGGSTGTGPKAYLNYLVFDRNFVFVTGGYVRMTTAAKEAGTNVPHEKLSAQVIITQPGYVYTYLTNEETTPVEVYFDDFKVTHVKWPVVQSDDYYPFGLAFNSYSRENSVPNKWKFQSQEHVDELGLNWDSFKWRNHQPEIGRFFNVDPLAEKYVYNSTYAFSENKVVAHVELEGLESGDAGKKEEKKPEQQQQQQPQSGAVNAIAYVMSWIADLGSTYNRWAGNKEASERENLVTGATVVGTLITAPAEHFVALGEGGEVGEAAAASKIDDMKPAATVELKFTQITASPMFSNEGNLAGQSINQVANGLRGGSISTTAVPVQFINRAGNSLIVNTRSSLALRQANIPQTNWSLVNVSGIPRIESQMTKRLLGNGLSNSGTSTLRITGSGSSASTLKP